MAEQQDVKKGLFSRPPVPDVPPAAMVQAASNSRIRVVEEKISNLNKKVELMETSFVSFSRKIHDELRTADAEIMGMKREFEKLNQKIDMIIRELKLAAGKDELTTIKRYLDMWDLTRFATRDEVEKMLAERDEDSEGPKLMRKDL